MDGHVARFRDRHDAGTQLAAKLLRYAGQPDTLVLGLPRGGVPVAYEVARALHAPLDVLMVRKLGVPGQEELAMGAIATGGALVLDEALVRNLGISPIQIAAIIEAEEQELARREQLYRDARPFPEVRDRTIVLIDDGMATGSTMYAAIQAIRQLGPRRLVVAVPTAALDTCDTLRPEVDDLVCLITPKLFYAVGLWYADFTPTTDDEVRQLLDGAVQEHTTSAPP
jgi:predicted phosphoribosyltransferase